MGIPSQSGRLARENCQNADNYAMISPKMSVAIPIKIAATNVSTIFITR